MNNLSVLNEEQLVEITGGQNFNSFLPAIRQHLGISRAFHPNNPNRQNVIAGNREATGMTVKNGSVVFINKPATGSKFPISGKKI